MNGDVSVIGRQYVRVVGLTVDGRIWFNSSTGVAITNNVVNAVGATGNGIDGALRTEDSYVADNIVTGQTVWAESSLGVSGANLGEGIRVNGPGHVVEHNWVSGFRDCLSLQEPESGGVDQYSLFTGTLGAVSLASLAELQTSTTERQTVQVDLGMFATAVAYPSSPFPENPIADLRLAADAAALDVGEPIANVSDEFAGSAPDLGAYELGAALPAYRPR